MTGRITKVTYTDDASGQWVISLPVDVALFNFQGVAGEARLYSVPREPLPRIPVEIIPRYVRAYVVNNNGTIRSKTVKLIIPDVALVPQLFFSPGRILSADADGVRGEIFYPTFFSGERRTIVPNLEIINGGLTLPRQDFSNA